MADDNSTKKKNQTTNIPRVPKDTPMFDGDGFAGLNAKLNRTWMIFFERNQTSTTTTTTPATAGGPYIRTLLIKDTTPGPDVADHVPIWVKGTAMRVIGVLRKTITADLGVGVVLNGAAMLKLTIPKETAVNTPVVSTAFISSDMPDLSILSFSITGSDGSKDAGGIASVTVQFQ